MSAGEGDDDNDFEVSVGKDAIGRPVFGGSFDAGCAATAKAGACVDFGVDTCWLLAKDEGSQRHEVLRFVPNGSSL